MRYAEKVMLHNLVQQTIMDKESYDALSDSADTRLWFMGKQRVLDILDDVIERYIFEYNVISKIAMRERAEIKFKNVQNEEAIRLYNIQADLLDEVVESKHRMIETVKSIRHSVYLVKSYSRHDINNLITISDNFIPKLRDLSDVARLLEKYEKPFYSNFHKS